MKQTLERLAQDSPLVTVGQEQDVSFVLIDQVIRDMIQWAIRIYSTSFVEESSQNHQYVDKGQELLVTYSCTCL